MIHIHKRVRNPRIRTLPDIINPGIAGFHDYYQIDTSSSSFGSGFPTPILIHPSQLPHPPYLLYDPRKFWNSDVNNSSSNNLRRDNTETYIHPPPDLLFFMEICMAGGLSSVGHDGL